MTKPLIALTLLALTLPLACSAEDAPPDPLARPDGFCEAWAEAACQQTVIDACNAPTPEDCVRTQKDFCLAILPAEYSSKQAKACVAAVKAAYKDADLTADEIQVVRYLGAPCDQLSAGTSEEGESCNEDEDCNTAGGQSCVRKLGAAEGTCQEPEVVDPGAACDGDAQVCDEDHYCNGENCVAYKKTGGACEGDYQCNPADRCVIPADADAGECTERVEASGACLADDDCQSHYCVRESASSEGQCASKIRLSITDPLCDDLQ
jgi:hypothetical protein